MPVTHFWYMTLKHWGYFHLRCPFKLTGLYRESWQRKNASYEDVWRTDRCSWCELAPRLKCAIMVTYDSEELGSCCRKHLTNGLHILLSFPNLTPNKCSSDGGGGAKPLKLRCYCLHTSMTKLPFSVIHKAKVKGTSVRNARQREIITIPLHC